MDWVVVGAQWLHVLLGIIWFGNSLVVAAILIPSLNRLPIPMQREVGSSYGERATRLFDVLVPVLIILGVVRGTLLGPMWRSCDSMVLRPGRHGRGECPPEWWDLSEAPDLR